MVDAALRRDQREEIARSVETPRRVGSRAARRFTDGRDPPASEERCSAASRVTCSTMLSRSGRWVCLLALAGELEERLRVRPADARDAFT